MSESKNFYHVLQVDQYAEDIVISAAYRSLAQKYHPDKNPDNASMMQEINEAYTTLSNNEKKASYDFKLSIDFTKEKEVQATTPETSTKKDERTGWFGNELAAWSNVITVIMFLISRALITFALWEVFAFIWHFASAHVSLK